MPEKQTTYTEKFTVYRTDGDHLGNVKLGALLRYAQQVATAHAEAVGLDDALYRKTHTAYVLAKLALHIERLPRVDEELTLLTQPENCKRAVNKRITHFYDASGAEAAVMDSRWVLIDTEKRIILRASTLNSSTTNGPLMSRLSCQSNCPASPPKTARCWGSSRLSIPAAI